MRQEVDVLSRVAIRKDPFDTRIPISLNDNGIRELQRQRMIDADNSRARKFRRVLRDALKLPGDSL